MCMCMCMWQRLHRRLQVQQRRAPRPSRPSLRKGGLSLARSRFSLFTGSSMGASKHWFRGRSKSPVQADEESAAGQASKPSPACGFRDSHGHFQALWRPSPDKDAADNVPEIGRARSGSTPSASRPASPVCAPSVHRYRPAESGHVFVLHCDAAGAPTSRRRPASACRSAPLPPPRPAPCPSTTAPCQQRARLLARLTARAMSQASPRMRFWCLYCTRTRRVAPLRR